VHELGDLRQLPLGETQAPRELRAARRTEARNPRNDGRDDTVSEQKKAGHVVLAQSKEPSQDLKVLVEKCEAGFGETDSLEFAAHHLQHPVDIKHQADADSFLSIPFGDMVIFSVLVGLAIYWRRKPELHRRLLFLGTCALLDAPFGRFDYLFNHSLFFLALDAVILLGVARDLLVNRRIHIVYRVALPSLVVLQALMVYLWRGAPAWWSNIGQALLG